MTPAELKTTLAHAITLKQRELQEWYGKLAENAPPPFYCSVDLRDSGFKIAPVDSNLYPAGFNNICPDDQRTAPAIVRAQLEKHVSRQGTPHAKKVLVLPEAHTSNAYYFENLYYLLEILKNAGLEVQLGWWGELPPEAAPPGTSAELKLVSQSGKELVARAIRVENKRLKAGGFEPDVILLNNDFSSGYPKALDEVEQPIVPSHVLGWHSRRKTDHFTHYNRLAEEFARIIGVDPWVFQIETERVDDVSFGEDQGIDRVEAAVARVLEHTRAAYEQRKVRRKPFVFVKNNSGTYGMGIMVVHSADELLTMNRRTKNKMSVGKGRAPIHSVAVQEGVPTTTIVERVVAEPVIYLVGCELIGGFLRSNVERSDEDNLNAHGMVFRKLCMSDLRQSIADLEDEKNPEAVLELVYGSVARLSALASGLELAELRSRAT